MVYQYILVMLMQLLSDTRSVYHHTIIIYLSTIVGLHRLVQQEIGAAGVDVAINGCSKGGCSRGWVQQGSTLPIGRCLHTFLQPLIQNGCRDAIAPPLAVISLPPTSWCFQLMNWTPMGTIYTFISLLENYFVKYRALIGIPIISLEVTWRTTCLHGQDVYF